MDRRWQELQELAIRQHGHFTTSQVEATGLSRPALNYQFRTGRLERPLRGIYRFAYYPPGDFDQEAVLMLWGQLNPMIALSRATALSYFDLGDAFPAEIHLTVPVDFRQCPPPGVVLHKAALTETDVQADGIIRVTKPLRAIFDLIRSGYPLEQLQLAYEQSLERGLIRHGGINVDSDIVMEYLHKIPKSSHDVFIERLRVVVGQA